MRARIFFEKKLANRYTSILDLQKIWERALRRASLSVEMTKGFNPHAKIQIANPLPVGFIGRNEIVDIFLDNPYSVEWIQDQLIDVLPEGIKIKKILLVPDKPKSLSDLYKNSEYLITIRDAHHSLIQNKIEQILIAEHILRMRNRKEYDLRPLIYEIRMISNLDNVVQILVWLSAEPGKTGRPDEIVFHLGYKLTDCIIERTRLF